MNQNVLTLRILEKLESDTLVLPSLPDIAFKVQQVADRESSGIKDMVRVIGTDPALSSRVLRISNTALVRGRVKVVDLAEACKRIGLVRLKTLAAGMVAEQLFDSTHPMVKRHLQVAWRESVEVASKAMGAVAVCSSSGADGDEMFLLGLLHNIGMLAILSEVEKEPSLVSDKKFLRETAVRMAPVLGGQILKSWNFDQKLVYAVERYGRKDQPAYKNVVTYTDYLRLAYALNRGFGSNSEKVIKNCRDKGMFTDDRIFKSEQFNAMRSAVITSFA